MSFPSPEGVILPRGGGEREQGSHNLSGPLHAATVPKQSLAWHKGLSWLEENAALLPRLSTQLSRVSFPVTIDWCLHCVFFIHGGLILGGFRTCGSASVQVPNTAPAPGLGSTPQNPIASLGLRMPHRA